ncbi:MAG: GGDEF-domain containing protein, partial [Oceanisphaera sp.]|nr:GGDEF-domain containing protein [Oceanisphaera sp.]
MKTFKLISLTIITLLFGASSLYGYYRDLEVVRYVSATIKGIGWSSSELEMELLKFDQSLTALMAQTAD